MIADVIVHFIIGAIAAATGFTVRGFCSHRGFLPHPVQQVGVTGALVLIESIVAVALVG